MKKALVHNIVSIIVSTVIVIALMWVGMTAYMPANFNDYMLYVIVLMGGLSLIGPAVYVGIMVFVFNEDQREDR